jgi:hypothetical protein
LQSNVITLILKEPHYGDSDDDDDGDGDDVQDDKDVKKVLLAFIMSSYSYTCL